jgi:hypothetical protein
VRRWREPRRRRSGAGGSGRHEHDTREPGSDQPGPGLAAPRHPARRRGAAAPTACPFARGPDLEVGGVRLSLSDYMARSRTAGLLVLKGEIALERYGMGSGPGAVRRATRPRSRSPRRSSAPRSTMARSAAWTIVATSTCRGCAARPMRASRSATSCECAQAWPGASWKADSPTSSVCARSWRAGGRAPSWP